MTPQEEGERRQARQLYLYKLEKVRDEIEDLRLASGVVKQIYTFWKQEQELRIVRIIEKINRELNINVPIPTRN